jgi:beta-glucosidase
VYGADRLAPMPSSLTTCPHCGEPGFAVRYHDAGRTVRSEHRRSGHLVWFGTDILHGATVEISAVFRADEAGEWQIGFAGVGELTLTINGETVIDEVVEPERDSFAASFLDPPERYAAVAIHEGDTVDVELQLRHLAPPEDFAALTLGVRRPHLPPDRELARAIDLARAPPTPASSSWAPDRTSRAKAATAQHSRCPAARTTSSMRSPPSTPARWSLSTQVRRS